MVMRTTTVSDQGRCLPRFALKAVGLGSEWAASNRCLHPRGYPCGFAGHHGCCRPLVTRFGRGWACVEAGVFKPRGRVFPLSNSPNFLENFLKGGRFWAVCYGIVGCVAWRWFRLLGRVVSGCSVRLGVWPRGVPVVAGGGLRWESWIVSCAGRVLR